MKHLALLLAACAYGQQGLPGVTVSVGGFTAVTDANGYASVDVPVPFTGTVWASLKGWSFVPASVYLAGVTSPQDLVFKAVDIAPPTVTITVPDTMPSAKVLLTCTATDNAAVTRVDWSLDGAPIGSAPMAPWSLVWDASAIKGKGKHTLAATAQDGAGNRATATKVVRIQ